MAKSHVELDLFGLHNLTDSLTHPHQPQPQPQPQLQPQPRLDRRQSFRGIAKINPEIVKSVIASANATKSSSRPGSPTSSLGLSQLPLFYPRPFSGADSMEKAGETAPMTIFYNGTVSVYDLPNNKAERIMKLAMEKNASKNEEVVDHSCFKLPQATTKNILGQLNDDDGDGADMPIKRKKSLQRFFEKREERLVSPYTKVEHMAYGLHQQKS